MKTKRINLYITVATLALATLAACSGDDDLAPGRHPAAGDPGTIRFTASIADFADPDANPSVMLSAAKHLQPRSAEPEILRFAQNDNGAQNNGAQNDNGSAQNDNAPATRATLDIPTGKGHFEENDRTNIVAHVAGTNYGTTHPAAYHDEAWLTDLTWEDFGTDAKVNFTAFFPASSVSQMDQTIDIPTDQSTPEKYAAADILVADARNVQQSDDPIELRFHHALHRLVVKLVLSEHPGSLTQADLAAATVVIKDAFIRGKATSDGILSDYVTYGNILPLALDDNTFCALIPYMNDGLPVPPNMSIEVRAAGTVASYPIQWPTPVSIYPNGQTLIRLALANNEGRDDYITTFADLKAAIAAIPSGSADNPTRITLGADIEFPGTPGGYIDIPDNRYIEINGNGYRLTRADAAVELFTVNPGTSLKLTDMTVDGENKEPTTPLISVTTADLGGEFRPGTLTLGKGFTLTGATLWADASDRDKLNRTPGINVSGTLIMEEGSQVTGNGRGYPVHIIGDFSATLRLNGGTFSSNADGDVCLSGGGIYNTPATVTVGRPLPDGFACSLVLDYYLNADQSVHFPTIITGTGPDTIALTTADVQKFTLKTVFYHDANDNPHPSAPGQFSLYLNGKDIGLRREQ